MSGRDKRGNFVNDKGVVIKVSEYNGGVKMDFYDKDPSKKDHKSIHTHINDDGTYKTEDNVNGKMEKSSGKCYLTTACLKHFKNNFNDNCEELTILRWFRDNFVSKEDIDHYYEVAPIIIENLEYIENNELIYEYIYKNIICACINDIKQGNYPLAYARYKTSILILEKKYTAPTLQRRLINGLNYKKSTMMN